MSFPTATQRLCDWVESRGHFITPQLFPEGTKTAEQAASAIGCPVSAIVKSLVFMLDGQAVVTLIPGDRKLDPDRLVRLTEKNACRRASLEEAKQATSFSAGGTPPFGYPGSLPVYADRQLNRNDPVWAAGGTPTTVFPISLSLLSRLSGAKWADISE